MDGGADPATLRKKVETVLGLPNLRGLAQPRDKRNAIRDGLKDVLWNKLVRPPALVAGLPAALLLALHSRTRGLSTQPYPTPRHRTPCLQERFPEAPDFRVDAWGLMVARGARPRSPFYFNIDHVVPWALGGQDTSDNLAVVHAKLNNAKRDR